MPTLPEPPPPNDATDWFMVIIFIPDEHST